MFYHGEGADGGANLRGSWAKSFSWTICKHDFGPYPFDRELFFDIALIVIVVVRLVGRELILLALIQLTDI